jgi:hypothetical protein
VDRKDKQTMISQPITFFDESEDESMSALQSYHGVVSLGLVERQQLYHYLQKHCQFHWLERDPAMFDISEKV